MSLATSSLARPLFAPPDALAADAAAGRVATGAAVMSLDAETRRHAHLVVRVGREHFALPLESVAEGVETPQVLTVAGMAGQWLGFIDWRGQRVPLASAIGPFGAEAGQPCAAALILDDAGERSDGAGGRGAGPLAIAVDELCDLRALPPSALGRFHGRHDPLGVVSAVAWDGDTLLAVVSPPAVRAAALAAAGPPLVGGRVDDAAGPTTLVGA